MKIGILEDVRSPLRAMALALVAVALVAVAFSNAAQAQSGATDAHRFRMAEIATDGFAISRPTGWSADRFFIRLGFDYGFTPIAYEGTADLAGSERYRVVEHQLHAQLSGGFAIGDRVLLFASLPMQLLNLGEDAAMGAPAFLQAAQPRSFAVGDFALGARLRLFGGSADLVKLALAFSVRLPSASWGHASQTLSGEKNTSLLPQLLLEIGSSQLRWNANLGVRGVLGSNEDQLAISETRRTSGMDLTYSSSLVWSPIADEINGLSIPRLNLLAEIYGARAIDAFETAVLSPLELLLGVQAQAVDGFWLGLAAGPGIGRGLGTPDFRSTFTASYQELVIPPPLDSDHDGFLDRDDACPRDAEDVDGFEDDDGCPDLDNDQDGVLDALDHCPTGAEDHDEFQDEDGCPEPDNDRDTVSDTNDRCPNEAEDQDAFEDQDGCPDFDNDQDGVLDTNDACPLEPGQLSSDPALNGCSLLLRFDALRGRIDSLERIEFRPNRTEVLPNLEAILVEIARLLQRNPGIRRLRLEGHADSRGPDARNRVLAAGRATSVRDWFVAHGFAQTQFEVWTCGENVPRANNETDTGRQRNRRVEFHVSDPPPVHAETLEGCEAAP